MRFLRAYLVSRPETDVKSGVTKGVAVMSPRQLRSHMLVGCESLPLQFGMENGQYNGVGEDD